MYLAEKFEKFLELVNLNAYRGKYTEKQWNDEMKAPGIVIQFSSGPFSFGTTLPCPHCKTIGFYGPRKSPVEGETTRKYRACKFCGF